MFHHPKAIHWQPLKSECAAQALDQGMLVSLYVYVLPRTLGVINTVYSSREENTVKKQKPSDAAKRATSLTNLSQKPTPTETVAHSPATAGRDPPTVAAEGDQPTVAAEGDPTTVAAEGDPTTVAAEGDPPTVAAEGDPTTVAAEGDPTTATAGRDPPTVDKPPVKMSKHKQSNGEDKRLSEKNRGAKRVSVGMEY